MHEELKEEAIVNKVGGRFKLSTLIQKRLAALNRGARPLVELPSKNPMDVVIAEILQDKIFLDSTDKEAVPKGDESDKIDAGPSLADLE
jgi:DNA-directed RNA polymerase subunit omega